MTGREAMKPEVTVVATAGCPNTPGTARFPLMVRAFEGNLAETKTMLPLIEAFMTARQLLDETAMISLPLA
jgi:hypothetical protein